MSAWAAEELMSRVGGREGGCVCVCVCWWGGGLVTWQTRGCSEISRLSILTLCFAAERPPRARDYESPRLSLAAPCFAVLNNCNWSSGSEMTRGLPTFRLRFERLNSQINNFVLPCCCCQMFSFLFFLAHIGEAVNVESSYIPSCPKYSLLWGLERIGDFGFGSIWQLNTFSCVALYQSYKVTVCWLLL